MKLSPNRLEISILICVHQKCHLSFCRDPEILCIWAFGDLLREVPRGAPHEVHPLHDLIPTQTK